MKNLILFAIITFSFQAAYGEVLRDVEILDVKTIPEGEELKLKDLKLTPEGFFYVILDKTDKDALAKSGLVMQKLLKKEKSKLILEIDSFSSLVPGSMYQSSQVKFRTN